MENIKPKLGISIMSNPEFIAATLPLFQEAQVDVIEWSFDTILNADNQPEWLPLLLKEYGNNNRLLGHGVYYSLLDANWSSKQDHWLQKAKHETTAYNYNHVSEHFGLMSTQNSHNGYPLPIKLSNSALNIGIDRLKRLQNTVKLDVGIENLALASNVSDIMKQGAFIHKLVTPVSGFIILDLHNIYCQSENFNLNMMAIIKSYPLDLVKEIHVSGGSWDNDPALTKKIRRDTHNGTIPNLILEILPTVLKMCPALEYIIFERIGNAFQTQNDGIEFRADFKKIRSIINHTHFSSTPRKTNLINHVLDAPLIDDALFQEQQNLREHIKNDNYNANPEWDANMWKTARKLYTKWNRE